MVDRVAGPTAPFWYPLRGRSMVPALRPGDDVLFTPRGNAVPSVGDVVVTRHGAADHRVHRVVRVDADTVTTRGDACARPDAPVALTAVLFVATLRRHAGVQEPIPAPTAGLRLRVRRAVAVAWDALASVRSQVLRAARP
jgi:hypothetical protein